MLASASKLVSSIEYTKNNDDVIEGKEQKLKQSRQFGSSKSADLNRRSSTNFTTMRDKNNGSRFEIDDLSDIKITVVSASKARTNKKKRGYKKLFQSLMGSKGEKDKKFQKYN